MLNVSVIDRWQFRVGRLQQFSKRQRLRHSVRIMPERLDTKRGAVHLCRDWAHWMGRILEWLGWSI